MSQALLAVKPKKTLLTEITMTDTMKNILEGNHYEDLGCAQIVKVKPHSFSSKDGTSVSKLQFFTWTDRPEDNPLI